MLELHPRLVARDEAMRAAAKERGWHIAHIRTTASYSQQKILYARYITGTGNQAANPDAVGYDSPWGWTQRGSWHQEQADGYCHAIDYSYTCTDDQLYALCAEYGIGFPVVGEPWHAQWFDWRGIFINHHGDDMTKEEFAAAVGGHIPADGPYAGQVCTDLLNDPAYPGQPLNEIGSSPYPLALAIGFTHQELKMKRLGLA